MFPESIYLNSSPARILLPDDDQVTNLLNQLLMTPTSTWLITMNYLKHAYIPSHLMLAFKVSSAFIHVIYHWLCFLNVKSCLQSFARERGERWPAHLTGKVLPNCSSLQFYMVCFPRVSLHHPHKHIMGLLDILQVGYSPANWLRHERAWSGSHYTWLVCSGILLVQSPHLSFLCHC